MSEGRAMLRERPWLRAWLGVGLAAWATLGVLLVARANNFGLVDDITISPYHIVGYAALLTLAIYVGWCVVRARGRWRSALPPLYGGLGLGLILIVAWVVLDPIWQASLGINFGIEGALAPTRLLIPVALVLLAVGPVREAIAERAEPGLRRGELQVRWAGVVGAGLIAAAATVTAFNPVTTPLHDWAFQRGVDNTEIWTMRADGSAQTRILPALGDGVDYSLPAWSPDGTRIAYTAWTNEGGVSQNIRNSEQTSAIWTMAADGSDRRLVVDGAARDGAQAWIPAWSPDGQWIAYTLSPQGVAVTAAGPQENVAPGDVGPPVASSAGSSIWLVRPDGTDDRRLSAEGADALNPVWSPDGASIAFIVAAAGGWSDIHVATIGDAGLSDDVTVAGDPANDWSPAWSPDGARLVFGSNRSGNEEIWAAEIGGAATPRQLTDDGAGDWVPVFSPDGSRIVFVSDRTGEPEIWSMAAADGSDLRNLTNHPQHFDGQWSVAWSPDGSSLAFGVASFPDARNSGWVMEDFAAAQALIFGVALSILALLLVALGAPLGSFTVALTIVIAAAAMITDQWRFIPGGIAAGLIVDGLVRSVRMRWRARLAAALLPAAALLAVGLTIGASGGFAWSITLLLGVAIAAAAIGWGIAEAVVRLLPRPRAPETAPPEPA